MHRSKGSVLVLLASILLNVYLAFSLHLALLSQQTHGIPVAEPIISATASLGGTSISARASSCPLSSLSDALIKSAIHTHTLDMLRREQWDGPPRLDIEDILPALALVFEGTLASGIVFDVGPNMGGVSSAIINALDNVEEKNFRDISPWWGGPACGKTWGAQIALIAVEPVDATFKKLKERAGVAHWGEAQHFEIFKAGKRRPIPNLCLQHA
jgi:hypothetical protein